LLWRPPRTQGGFRQYAESDFETLLFIRRVQVLEFKLSETRGLSLPHLKRKKPTEAGGCQVKVEVLYVAECPSHPAAVKLVKEALAAEGVAADGEG
jgi:DNA-binding transcriptional MerR regulator